MSETDELLEDTPEIDIFDLPPHLVRSVLSTTFMGLVNSGVMTSEGKGIKEILAEAQGHLAGVEINFVRDHTNVLLKQARAYKRKHTDQFNELACVFYALWFEHQINKIIQISCEQFGLDSKDTAEIIRRLTYEFKITILLKLFRQPSFEEQHLKCMVKVMAIRNYYVHYKWTVEDEKRKGQIEDVLNSIEETIKYLKRYEKNNLKQISHQQAERMFLKSFDYLGEETPAD